MIIWPWLLSIFRSGDAVIPATAPTVKDSLTTAGQRIAAPGLDLIKSFESFVPYPYDDLLPAIKGVYREWKGGYLKGTLTIGYGHTDDAGEPAIKAGMRLTEKQAREILDADLDTCEAEVRRVVKAPMTQGQFDALVSFQFNTGGMTQSPPITLRKLLNMGDYAGAAGQFLRWNRAGGEVLAGLTRRRKAEVELFLSGV